MEGRPDVEVTVCSTPSHRGCSLSHGCSLQTKHSYEIDYKYQWSKQAFLSHNMTSDSRLTAECEKCDKM